MHPSPSANEILALIQNRRSLPTPCMKSDALDEAAIHQILEAANWAPSHRHTEPWRFRLYQSQAARDMLGRDLAEIYKAAAGDAFFEAKYEKTRTRAGKVPLVAAVICQPGEKAALPLYEEILAVGCAVQNMHLAAHALGIGMIWSTPGYYNHPDLRRLMAMAPDDHFMGFLYFGYPAQAFPTSKRRPIAEKVTWL